MTSNTAVNQSIYKNKNINTSRPKYNNEGARVNPTAHSAVKRPVKRAAKKNESTFYCIMRYFVLDGIIKMLVTAVELFTDSKARKKSEERYKSKKAAKKNVESIALVSYAITFSAILIFLALSFSKVNEYTKEIEGLNNSLAEAASTAERLEIQIDAKEDLRYIEHEAVSRLGMIKEENVQKQYVSLKRNDIVEVKPDSENKANISVIMSGAAELLSDLFPG